MTGWLEIHEAEPPRRLEAKQVSHEASWTQLKTLHIERVLKQ